MGHTHDHYDAYLRARAAADDAYRQARALLFDTLPGSRLPPGYPLTGEQAAALTTLHRAEATHAEARRRWLLDYTSAAATPAGPRGPRAATSQPATAPPSCPTHSPDRLVAPPAALHDLPRVRLTEDHHGPAATGPPTAHHAAPATVHRPRNP